eukprot:870699-Rhodomonas_salina.1
MARVPSSKELAAALPTRRQASTVCKRAASLCSWMSRSSPRDARPSCLASHSAMAWALLSRGNQHKALSPSVRSLWRESCAAQRSLQRPCVTDMAIASRRLRNAWATSLVVVQTYALPMSTRSSVMEESTSWVTPWPNWKGTWTGCQGTGTGTWAGCGMAPDSGAGSGVPVSMAEGVSQHWVRYYLRPCAARSRLWPPVSYVAAPNRAVRAAWFESYYNSIVPVKG